jgi:predicted PurR-regulated permease PerM
LRPEHQPSNRLYAGGSKDFAPFVNTKFSSGDIVRSAVIAVAVVVFALLAWRVMDVLLVAFGGVVFAAVFRALAEVFARFLRLPVKVGVLLAVLLLLGVLGGMGWLFGDQLVRQFDELQVQLPKAIEAVKVKIGHLGGGQMLDNAIQSTGDPSAMAGKVAKVAGVTAGFLGHAVVMLFVGIYLALDPDVYVRILVRLFPPHRRTAVRGAFAASGDALRKWLIGQLAAMATVGVLTSIGLGFAGVPLALALGVLAGLLDFVPVVGPVVAAVPGIILAAGSDPTKAVYAALVYVAVQQLENHIIVPLTQRWSVSLPPAISLLAILASGLVFGLLGVIFAMPLTVVAMVLIRRLYLPAIEKKDAADS